MRIACVHVPQFALQTLTRIDPSLRGAAVAVVGAGGDAPTSLSLGSRAALYTPVVQACSRAAWALGVRIGMTATAANGLAPGQLRVVVAEPALERETVRAIADALLAAAPRASEPNGASPIVDLGGRVGAGGAHLAMYCSVPSKTRGASFGEQLVELLAEMGLTARIGIADDRFTAWVAAAHAGTPGEESGVVAVPRGGSAAFLAPRPLSLLSISPEVQHMLEALGVRTLGEFAALPAPSAASRASSIEADYRALARGESGQTLRSYAPEAPIREDVVVGPGITTSSAIASLARRTAMRLAGRGRGASALELVLSFSRGEDQIISITPLGTQASLVAAPRRVLESADDIASELDRAFTNEAREGTAVTRMRLVVTGEALPGAVLDNALASETRTSMSAMALRAPSPDATRHVLSVVLSTTGSAEHNSWSLISPDAHTLRNERRDAHRRMRRGKQRRGRDLAIQARLFADRPSK
ncbi:MAG: hypothetical protein SFX73_20025 [Kofleriaceae bacterium]|nr:hypothetical protein [Kofleriaceae bacterium]